MDSKSFAVQRQNLFFQNLLALGFDVLANEQKYKIKFDKKTFCLPNQKAFEIVSHFLFEKLNEVSSKKYVLPWPLLNVKAHREFQKTCFSYVSIIAQESTVKFPLVSSSVLSSYGEAFYELYFAFSTHVVWATNQKFSSPMLQRPRTDIKYYEKTIEVLENATIASYKRFMNVVELTKYSLEDFVQCANNAVCFINILKRTNSTNQSLLNSRIHKAKDIFMVDNCHSLDDIVEKCSEYQSKVKTYNSYLEQFFMIEENFWNSMCSELEETSSKPVLKGCGFNNISNILEKCSEEFKIIQAEDNNTFILKYLKLFSIVLQIYLSSIIQGSFPKTQVHTQYLSKEISAIEDFIKKITSLSPLLEENNRLARLSINELSENMDGPVENLFKIQGDFPCSVPFCDVSEGLKLSSYEVSSEEIKLESLANDNKFEEIKLKSLANNDEFEKMKLESFACDEFKEMKQIEITDSLYSTIKSDINFEFEHSDGNMPSKFTDEIVLSSQMESQASLKQNVNDTTNEDVESNTVTDQVFKNSSFDSYFSQSFLHEESLNSQSLTDVSFLE